MSTGGRFTPGSNVRAPQYPEETLANAVKDADRLGLKISAHCHATSGIRNCVKAGIHNLIHCSWLPEDPEAQFDYDTDYFKTVSERYPTFLNKTIKETDTHFAIAKNENDILLF